jgi:hypothetical protein
MRPAASGLACRGNAERGEDKQTSGNTPQGSDGDKKLDGLHDGSK